MQQTSELLDLDSTIYAISAFNVHAFPHTAFNASRLYRDDSFPSIGWMVSRAFLKSVLPMWPSVETVKTTFFIDYLERCFYYYYETAVN